MRLNRSYATFFANCCRRLAVHQTAGTRRFVFLMIWILLAILASPAFAQSIRVDITPDHVANKFVPNQALGAGIDRMSAAAIDKLFTPEALEKVLSAGWQPVTYRQNTELHIEAWHWNPKGTWSDPSGKGYFTGSAEPTEIIRNSYGYPLPHRGATRNDGTDANGYGRLTDGDENTYWKSNPYLTKGFTGKTIRCIHSGLWSTLRIRLPSTPSGSHGLILTRNTIACSTGRASSRSLTRTKARGSRFQEARSRTGKAAP